MATYQLKKFKRLKPICNDSILLHLEVQVQVHLFTLIQLQYNSNKE